MHILWQLLCNYVNNYLVNSLGSVVYSNTIVESHRLEGTCRDHLVQCPPQTRFSWNRVLRAVSSEVLTVPKDGDSLTPLSICSSVWPPSWLPTPPPPPQKGHFLELIVTSCVAACLLPLLLPLCSSEKSLDPLLLCSSISWRQQQVHNNHALSSPRLASFLLWKD